MVKIGGVGGTAKALLVVLLCGLVVVGSKYTTSQAAACTLPEPRGRPGVLLFGDSALLGLADKLPGELAGGGVTKNIRGGRTAQQGLNELVSMPEDAEGTLVVSLALDDPGEQAGYTERIHELMFTLSGRRTLWVTVPGRADLNDLVLREAVGEWRIIDFARSVQDNPSWWSGNRLTSSGARHLADTISGALVPPPDTPTPVGDAAASIRVVSSSTGEALNISGERRANAQTVIDTGVRLGVPPRGLIVGIATALQESRLINLDHGDRDSLGLYQQRPSQGWGTPEQIRDPQYAATKFFTRLLQVPGWERMAVTDAAQAVQISGFPLAYAQWEAAATRIVAALQGQSAPGCGAPSATGADPRAQTAVAAAMSQLGVPYVWGGGSAEGPTSGTCGNCRQVGWDCSGLMLYAWAQAGVHVPHYTVAMWNSSAFTHLADRTQLQPGDMVMFHQDGVPDHVGMYIGDNTMVHAPRTGDVVKTETLDSNWSRQHYLGAIRPKA